MICYCHHCGAILNSENDTCPACGCRGAAFQSAHDNHCDGERERFCPFCGEEVPATAASCPFCKKKLPCESAESPSASPQQNPTVNKTRKRRFLYDLGILGAFALLVLLFLLMVTVTPK